MKIIPFAVAVSFSVSSLLASPVNCAPFVGAYYENWSQYRLAFGGRAVFFSPLIDPTILTDLYYAFAVCNDFY